MIFPGLIRARRSAPIRCAPQRALLAMVCVSLWLGVCISQAQPRLILPLPGLAPDLDPGELLLGGLNCIACHEAGPELSRRLSSKPAPLLGTNGLKLTPQWMQRHILKPNALKSSSAMPNILHGLSAGEQTERVEDLVHFLVSVQDVIPDTPSAVNQSRFDSGKRLYSTVGCVACHAPQERRGDLTDDQFALGTTNVFELGDLARKYSVGQLARFLMDPVRFHPAARMPSMNLAEKEATAIAMYLLREQAPGIYDPTKPLTTVPGLRAEYFEGRVNGPADFEGMTIVSEDTVDTISIAGKKRPNQFGFRFSGLLEVLADGEYQFWLESDDGSRLYLDGKEVINNDGMHPMTTKRARQQLSAGSHPLAVHYIQGDGDAELRLFWAGPGFRRQPIPVERLRHPGQPMRPLDEVAIVPDSAKVARGRRAFTQQRCVACHEVSGTVLDTPVPSARPLEELSERTKNGCLAQKVPATAPDFSLSRAQRDAMAKTLGRLNSLKTELSPSLSVRLELARNNCFACHSRDGFGGPAATGKEPWFTIVGDADLGDEGRIPPLLTGVGGKLRPEWLRGVLLDHAVARPYMATRMPQFGESAVGNLTPLFRAADVLVPLQPAPPATPVDAKVGWKLAGRDGLSCIACHTFGKYGSMGIPAAALDQMYQRLEWDWFRRYLPDPAALRPGTRMPTFWPDGKAANREIAGGDTGLQIRALWAYLAGGPKAEVPLGLIRGRMEIVSETEPLIYRNFIEGAGSRAIGVGYPEKVNLAFDANDLRLALLWQGSFIDAARHSNDRGVGFEPPLGDHLIKFPAGIAFAELTDSKEPWPQATESKSRGHFLGYRLGDSGRPAFLYSFGPWKIEDVLEPKVSGLDMTLVRRLRLIGPARNDLWFRAAAGEIQSNPDGSYFLDGRMRIRVSAGGTPQVVGNEIRVPVAWTGNEGRIEIEMTW